LLREQMAEIAGDLTAQMAPAIQAAIRQALHDELQELTPDTVGELAAAACASRIRTARGKERPFPHPGHLCSDRHRGITDQDYFDSDTDLRAGNLMLMMMSRRRRSGRIGFPR
jgi:hypothetical protein